MTENDLLVLFAIGSFVIGLIGGWIAYYITKPKSIYTNSEKTKDGDVICPRCGKETPNDGLFCLWCGCNIAPFKK
jgi:hypothetical protein